MAILSTATVGHDDSGWKNRCTERLVGHERDCSTSARPSQASSVKRQASSVKRQASSVERDETELDWHTRQRWAERHSSRADTRARTTRLDHAQPSTAKHSHEHRNLRDATHASEFLRIPPLVFHWRILTAKVTNKDAYSVTHCHRTGHRLANTALRQIALNQKRPDRH